MATKSKSRSTSIARVAPRAIVVSAPRRSGIARRARTAAAAVVRSRRAKPGIGGAAMMGQLATLAGAAALGFAEATPEGAAEPRFQLPTVAGVDPALVWGFGLGFLAPHLVRGRAGKMLAQVGTGMATVGVFRSVQRGSVKVEGIVGDDEDY